MSELGDRIKNLIRETGPINVGQYMGLCLLDPKYGYYPTRDPLGSDGDFITAPEISQMFGEVLGLWLIQSWQDMGKPETINIVELGPGRGIMMSDMIRSAQLMPEFSAAMNIYLIEASAALQAVQGQNLAQSPRPVMWINNLDDLPEAPTIIVGNEYLDCLPIRQFIQKDPFAGRAGWHEREVILDPDTETLKFGVAPEPISDIVQSMLSRAQEQARTDDLLEICPPADQLLDQIKTLSSANPLRALFIDYGPELTEFGDTLQALKRHEKVGVFSDPGNTDLTARVDFEALGEKAQELGLSVTTPVPQSEFLSKLGIELRAATLAKAKPESKAVIARQLERLTGEEQMGQLFKSICIQSPGLGLPLGFRTLK